MTYFEQYILGFKPYDPFGELMECKKAERESNKRKQKEEGRSVLSADPPQDSAGQEIRIGDRVHMLSSEDMDYEWDDVVDRLAFYGRGGGDEWVVEGELGEAWACDCTVIERKETGDER